MWLAFPLYDKILGHLSFSPSNQRIYNNSAIGDFLGGSSAAIGPEVEGSPESSSSSVTTNPFEVISLFRMIRL